MGKSLAFWIAGVLAAAFGAPAPLDPASLSSQLREMRHTLDRGGTLPRLPAAWEVETPQGRYTISTEPLRNSSPEQAKIWLDHLASELEGFSAAPVHNGHARNALRDILARTEFAGVGPPSAWERFRERLNGWLRGMLDRLFGILGRNSIAGNVLFWLILAGATGALVFWLARFWMRRDNLAAIPRGGAPARTRTGNEWIEAARQAAQEGDLRKAIQCAYWAGIARLQETGTLPRDLTRTPREYLRLLRTPARGRAAAAPAVIDPLAALTARLERFWYACQTASAEDFRECLGSLEALGCRLE